MGVGERTGVGVPVGDGTSVGLGEGVWVGGGGGRGVRVGARVGVRVGEGAYCAMSALSDAGVRDAAAGLAGLGASGMAGVLSPDRSAPRPGTAPVPWLADPAFRE